MTKQRNTTFIIILVLGTLYFLLFIPPSLTGAQDADMLSIFETDEFAQYPHLVRMLTSGATPYESLRNFTVYLHYFYGYPFYFFSALSVLPIRLFCGENWSSQTPLIMMTLRQMMSVLPMLIAAILLTYTQTRFKPVWKAIPLFALLLALPAVISNNTFWHPDSLSFLFVALTIFFLDLDVLAYKKYFVLAAVACGMAISVKNQGLFFFIAIPVYLAWGAALKKISWRRSVILAGIFVAVMVATVIISNPLLLLPIERSEIITLQQRNLQQLAQGFIFRTTDTYFQLKAYPEDFRIHYGDVYFILLAIAALVIGIVRPQKRLTNVLILAWIIPLAYSLNMAGTRRTHYFLPVVIPLLSALVHAFPDSGSLSSPDSTQSHQSLSGWVKWLFPWIAMALCVSQFVLFLRSDVDIYHSVLTREQTSPALAFARTLESDYLSKIDAADERLIIYRDWHMYLSPAANRRIEMSWDLAKYELINDLKPNLILLEQANIEQFSDPSAVEKASDPEAMTAWQQFYSDASTSQVSGYQLLYQDSFGLVLIKDDLYQKYFNRSISIWE